MTTGILNTSGKMIFPNYSINEHSYIYILVYLFIYVKCTVRWFRISPQKLRFLGSTLVENHAVLPLNMPLNVFVAYLCTEIKPRCGSSLSLQLWIGNVNVVRQYAANHIACTNRGCFLVSDRCCSFHKLMFEMASRGFI